MMKYPLEIVSLVRKKTFSVSASFSQETGDRPLKIFTDISRLRFTIINENKVVSTANLKPTQVEAIRLRSEYAFRKYLEQQYEPQTSAEESSVNTDRPAFTIRFIAGTLKGKTPADVLRENGKEKGSEVLNNQYKWLKDNLSKYPGNKNLMEAIVDAAKLAGSDLQCKTAEAKPVVILPAVSKPIMRKQRKDGSYLVNEMSVIWDNSRNNPVTVYINNYYAPVIQNEDGTLNVQVSKKDKTTEIRNGFAIGADEWMNCLKEIHDCIENYKEVQTGRAWKLAMDAFFENQRSAQ